ncbi:hypothetical protein E4U41_004403 [Claviceps citrina]|nr:hypothetical protein E4U41_004403 [Claviceps citrina]
MASSTSLKDLTKAINAVLDDPSLPLPDSFLGTVNAFLQRRQEYDDSAADQLQESLLSIFDKRVRGDDQSAGSWIAIIRRILPVLRTPERILPWFDACKDSLDGEDVDKCVVDEAVAALMEVATLIDEFQVPYAGGSASKPVIRRLFRVWMKRFYPALLGGNPASGNNERVVRLCLCQFGRKRPKELFAAMGEYFVQKTYRTYALRFLCDFIQCQPPHLYQVLETPLFSYLLLCLQRDTSTTVVSAALTALIMLLPHMPSSLVPHLPALFNIYGRLLFWDRARSRPMEAPDGDGGGVEMETSSRWEVAAFDAQVDDQNIAHLPNYFTILYGLYPINLMDYIRKPRRYLRHANASHADHLEVQPTEMRLRSERFRRNHLLHPNFYSLTIESERTDFSRWIKSEAAEVVAECMGLCLETDMYNFADLSTAAQEPDPEPDPDPDAEPEAGGVPAGTNGDNDTTDGSKADVALLSGSGSKHDGWRYSHPTASGSVSSTQTPATVMRRSSQSSLPSHGDSGDGGRPRPSGMDSPTLTLSPSHPQLQDLIQSNKAIKSGLYQSPANDSTPSLDPSHHELLADKHAPAPPPPSSSPFPASESASLVAHLQKLVLLLQNDLSFERYLKRQHMAHIGDLRRRQMSEAATEAETQNLILLNRNLKSRFEDAKMSEMQAKKESERSRALAKKWEAKLAHKLKTLRDESKRTQADMEALQKEVDELKSECDKLRKLLCAAEVKELNFRQMMQSLETDGTQVESLKTEVERLTRTERDHQAREAERERAMKSAAEAGNRAEVLGMKLAALEGDGQRTRRLFQTQIKALQAQLSGAQEERERPGANSNIAIETALAASRAKQAELQTQYGLLMRKYTALQSSLLDMQSEHGQEQQQASLRAQAQAQAQGHLADTAADYSSSEATGRGKSLAGDDATPTPQTGGCSPVEAPGSACTPKAPPLSPDQQRHFAGFQRLRRESRDKSKDDGGGAGGSGSGSGSGRAKKEKKSSGLRGIRGFV